MGWITVSDGSCTLDEELTGGYVPAPVIFDLDGGTFGSASYAKAQAPITNVNSTRPNNSLILFDNSYTHSNAQTNKYGAEAAVDANGIVISSPVYGSCQTAIPKGGFVLSAIGTPQKWLTANVSIGNYVHVDKSSMTVYVYESYESYCAIAKRVGIFNGRNQSRPIDTIIVYDSEYQSSNTPTNPYGTEVSVDSTGKVLNSPKYGTCKSEIPEGGFVLSGVGTGNAWLLNNIEKGNHVSLDLKNSTITVYENTNTYLADTKATSLNSPFGYLPIPLKSGYSFDGWYLNGEMASVDTVCKTPFCITLKASWGQNGNSITFVTDGGSFSNTSSVPVLGMDQPRPIDSIVIYTNGSVTPTNEYGCEVRVGADGTVLDSPVYGTCKTEIPEGGFVISGIGTMYKWMKDNLGKDMIATFDAEANTLTIYNSKSVYDTIHKTVVTGTPIGKLPAIEKEYHKFLGWYTISGERITENTVMPLTGITLYAKWEVLPGALSFDTTGGSIHGLISSAPLAGINIHRAANTLVAYNNQASTKTNVYGTEVLIDASGTICAVYPYGSGNCSIPEGCTVLSGIGTMYTWLHSYALPGRYVTIENGTVYIWHDLNSYKASFEDEVLYGTAYGALPTAQKEGYLFLGWKDSAGNQVVEGSTVKIYGDVTLKAQWEKLCKVTFDPSGGKLDSTAVTEKISGINIGRKIDSLVVYAGKASTGTNQYGREALVSLSGEVLAVYSSGKGNYDIPHGCYVLSGIGTMNTWMGNNLSVGKYIRLNEYTLTVYDSRTAFDGSDGQAYVRKGDALGLPPQAKLEGKAFLGWHASGVVYTHASPIVGDITLLAKWADLTATLIFDANGGIINKVKASTVINGTNIGRSNNTLIVYNDSYGAATKTNVYGGEVAVSAEGYALSTPKYGSCKTAIPKGGYVLSGIGSMYTWLAGSVKEGDYIHLDKESGRVSVYRSYGDYVAASKKTIVLGEQYGALPTPERAGYIFAGWKNSSGSIVNEKTKVSTCEYPVLTAVWKKAVTVTFDLNGGSASIATAPLSGTNIHRALNCLVLYKDKATTGTNIYGSEAILDSTGKVIRVFPYGKGNNEIPEGCSILSGNGTMNTWVRNSLKVGCYVEINGSEVTVYHDRASMDRADGTLELFEGAVIGELPTPAKSGYVFDGWYENDKKITADSVITKDTVIRASWKKA